MINMKG